ncbi:hypothetical protein SCFA_240013 [anaerobic digester metagenome]|uniref:Uncharacterized protein n=1 Tax=anaerobic digester metagenome TaxID=1263854 RepID=A0A485LZ57_9ZZZZ
MIVFGLISAGLIPSSLLRSLLLLLIPRSLQWGNSFTCFKGRYCRESFGIKNLEYPKQYPKDFLEACKPW